jgi:isopentenyl diphosphate isomerase/L-lactate dehydrogenase-like FMN-dependent dehydrogenase
MLSAALEGREVLHAFVAEFLHALRVVLFLTGCASVPELRNVHHVVTGRTADWLRALGHAV